MLSTIPILSSVSENENTPQIHITSRTTNASDLSLLRSLFGVAQEGQNYNIIIDGHGTGLKPPSEAALENMIGTTYLVQDITLAGADSLPPIVDHSQSIHFPPIGHQGTEGSCVAFAVGYYVKTFQEAQEQGWDLSGGLSVNQDKIISPDFIYHQINDGEDRGSSYYDAMTLVSLTGACTWLLMPYDDGNHTTWPVEAAWREAPLYRGEGGFSFYNFSTSVDSLKTYLTGGNLAVISIDGTQYSSLDSNDLWTLDNYVYDDTNHANTVVGYDDNFGPYTESGNPNTYGAFKVVNSWGAEWTGDGFYWISYEAMRRVVGYYMFYGDKIGYDPEVIGVFEISHDKRGECDITIGTGDPATSTNTKEFAPYYHNGGPEPFPNNKIILDITELNPYGQDVFIKIYDGGDTTTGTLSSFSFEFYTTYDKSGNADGIIQSGDPPIVTVQNGSIYAIGHPNIALSAIPASMTADGVSVTTLTADVKDEYGDPVPDGTTITFIASAGTLSSPTANTTGGIATVTLTSSTVAQIVNIIATDGPSSGGTTVTFEPGPPASITLIADPASIVADGTSITTLNANVKDVYGNAVADGTTIAFGASAGTLSSPTANTVNGIASVTLTSLTVAQSVAVSATYDTISDSTTVTFEPGPPATITLTAAPSSIAADGVSTSTLTADVKDEYGNAVADGTNIAFSASAGTLSSPTANTTGGIATVTLTSSTVAQSVDVSATYDTISDAKTVTFEPGPPATITLTATPNAIPADGVSTSTLTADVKDAYGNSVVDGTAVAFSVSAGTLSSPTANTTGGIATVTLTSDTTIQTVNVSATYDTITGTATVEFAAYADINITLYHGWNEVCLPFSVEMENFISNINGDYDGYLYWFDSSEQRYKYYNVVEKTGEPEYVSEFHTLPVGENIWLWIYDETGSITIHGIREDNPLTVAPGWNAIGCTNEESTTMEEFIATLDAINTDYDGYLYWFDDSEQRYKYYNVVEKTGEPEYVSEFTEYVPGDTYWVYYFS